MQPSRKLLTLILLLCFIIAASGTSAYFHMPTPPPPPTDGSYELYTVRLGDTLSRIAMRFGTTISTLVQVNHIVNADLIYEGQQIYVPSEGGTVRPAQTIEVTTQPLAGSTETATDDVETPATGASATAIIVPSTTPLPVGTAIGQTAQVAPALDTPTPFPGLAITTAATLDLTPFSTEALPAPTAETLEPTSTPTEIQPPPAMEFGMELFAAPDRIGTDAALLTVLGSEWAKLNVRWSSIEAVPGVYDYANLDTAISTLTQNGQKILLNVSQAPDWARDSQDENGPPSDFSLFADFLTELAAHYAGQVAAYEIWNEPNLRREWNNQAHPIGATSYAQMLQLAYTAIKTADPQAMVITAGLAPTGIDDGFNAVNDRRFFTDLLQAGVAQFSDGFGLHPFGYASPPNMRCCNAPEGVTSHYGDTSFYFGSMLDTYVQLASAYGVSDRLWITDFGWGIAEPGADVPRNFAYINFNTPQQQAQYTVDALAMAKDLGLVRVMILSNLNGCMVDTGMIETCYLSVLASDNTQRPVFQALRDRALTESSPG